MSIQREAQTKLRPAGGDSAALEAVDRATRVLFALAAQPFASGLAEIAARAELTKPTAFRILATLAASGYVSQNAETGAYRLGSGPLRLAASVLRDIPVREPALAAMGAVRDSVNESVVLSLRQRDYRYNIDSVEAANAIGRAQQIGVAIPLYSGAASRAMLAGLESEELLSYLTRVPLIAYSQTTIIDRDRLLQNLADVRARGYAVSNGEFASPGHAVAMAIRDPAGRAIAAIHVSAPRSRFSAKVEAACVAALGPAVKAIESRLRETFE